MNNQNSEKENPSTIYFSPTGGDLPPIKEEDIEKGSDDDHILLVSDNPDYKPFEIPTSEIFGVAIVNGLIRVE